VFLRKRIIELSHDLHPGQEEYGLEVESRFVDEVYPAYKRRPDVWYILQTVRMSSHVGTHIEFPRHFDPQGLDSASFPLQYLVGPACVLDFRHKQDNEAITEEDVHALSGLIRESDIVFLRTGRHVLHNTPRAHDRPYLTPGATRWLVEAKSVHVIGVDASGIEVKGTDHYPDHAILLREHGCALIEALGDLGQLSQSRVDVFILPLRIHGLDACPVRVVAIEDEAGT
jgi:arylformamidase